MIFPRVAPTQRTFPAVREALRGCALVCSIFLCFSAVADSIQPKFPVEAALNREAGRGGHIIVTFRLDDDQELPLLVDTGAPFTMLDKSLRSKLGKRIGSTRIGFVQPYKVKRLKKYAAPKIYLGTFLLTTSNNIVLTDDFKHFSSAPGSTMGVLGLDVLRHYCLQLDFESGKFRLLESSRLNKAELGKAFPLTYSYGAAIIHHAGLIGPGTNYIIDTGCNIDGLVSKGKINGTAVILPQCVWDGECYTGLVVAAPGHVNVLGLGFLARHLVTFDFPSRTLYLKQTMSGPLSGNIFKEIGVVHRAPAEFLEGLKEKGQLPGVQREEEVTIYFKDVTDLASKPANAKEATYLMGSRIIGKSETFDFYRTGDPTVFHYQIVQVSNNDSWKLQKAWRTDQHGHLVEQYSIPSA